MTGIALLRVWCGYAGPNWSVHVEAPARPYRLLFCDCKVLYCYDTVRGMTVWVDAATPADERELSRCGEVLTVNWDHPSPSKRGLRIRVEDATRLLDWCGLVAPDRPLLRYQPARSRRAS